MHRQGSVAIVVTLAVCAALTITCLPKPASQSRSAQSLPVQVASVNLTRSSRSEIARQKVKVRAQALSAARKVTPPVPRVQSPVLRPGWSPQRVAPSGSVVQMIISAFGRVGAISWALAVARCESGYNPGAYNPSGASGIFQFLPSTWAETPFASYSPFNAWANVQAAVWLYQHDGPGQWQCSALVG